MEDFIRVVLEFMIETLKQRTKTLIVLSVLIILIVVFVSLFGHKFK